MCGFSFQLKKCFTGNHTLGFLFLVSVRNELNDSHFAVLDTCTPVNYSSVIFEAKAKAQSLQ